MLTSSCCGFAANGADKPGASQFVLNSCNIRAAANATVAPGAYALGRPWGPFASVVFQNTSMSAAIRPAGWSVWEPNDPRTDNVNFAEFNNSGPGAAGERAAFARKLDAPVGLASVLTGDFKGKGYFDAAYFDPGHL